MQIDQSARFPSLEPVREEVVAQLTRGAADKKSPLRWPTVTSVGSNGRPEARIMILRAFHPSDMSLLFYTDTRSPKWASLSERPFVEVLFYNSGQKTQMRVSGEAILHTRDEMTEKLWSDLPEYGRGDYLSRQPPGEQIAHPGDSWVDESFGSDNFGVVEVRIQAIDWLKLSHEGHKRALLTWDNGQYSARWVTP